MSATDRPVELGVNLKLYFDPDRTQQWSNAVAALVRRHEAMRSHRVRLFILPSFPMIPATVRAFAGSGVGVGGQDLFWQDRGAFTGGVSGADLRALGCEYVEIGHAERRRVFGEDGGSIRRKLGAAFRNQLCPVICVGERNKVPAQDAAVESIAELEELLGANAEQDDGQRLLVAYEPEWAIGADHAASPEHVRQVVATIRAWLDRHRAKGDHAVMYGGSAGPGLLEQLDGAVDGLFLGRFVHDPWALAQILDEVLRIR